MEDKRVCKLGEFRLIDQKGRLAYECDWEVTPAFIRVCDRISESIDGVSYVSRFDASHFSVACESRRDLTEIAKIFGSKLSTSLEHMTDDQISEVRMSGEVDPGAMAVYSTTRSQ